MSNEEALDGNESDTQVLTAEYKDGRLQILDVSSLHNGEMSFQQRAGSGQCVQVVDPENGVMQLNLTLVRCEDSEGDSSYRLVTNSECEGEDDSEPVTCVLHETDDDNDVSYVVLDESEQDQLVLLEPGSDEPYPGEPDPDDIGSTVTYGSHGSCEPYGSSHNIEHSSSVPHDSSEQYISSEPLGSSVSYGSSVSHSSISVSQGQIILHCSSVPHDSSEVNTLSVPHGSKVSTGSNVQHGSSIPHGSSVPHGSSIPHGSSTPHGSNEPHGSSVPHSASDSHSKPPSEPPKATQTQVRPQKTGAASKLQKQIPKLTPEELIQRAYALRELNQKSRYQPPPRGRKRRALPSPRELLASPNFKLFLYSCKQCAYKCNAIKDLTAHRTTEHNKPRGNNQYSAFQCGRCPYRASMPQQLTKHMEEKHWDNSKLTIGKMITLDSKEVEEADILVCGACGFECADREEFKRHIQEQHM